MTVAVRLYATMEVDTPSAATFVAHLVVKGERMPVTFAGADPIALREKALAWWHGEVAREKAKAARLADLRQKRSRQRAN